MSTTTELAPAQNGDPAAGIPELRTEIDACDDAIIELVQRRLAVSREIGRLRASAGGTRLSLSREQQILAKFQAALGPDGAALGLMLLRQGRGRL
jgi:chorismate mutase